VRPIPKLKVLGGGAVRSLKVLEDHYGVAAGQHHAHRPPAPYQHFRDNHLQRLLACTSGERRE